MGTVGTMISVRKNTSGQNVKILKTAKSQKAVRNGTPKGTKDMPQEIADLKMVVPINTKSQPPMKIMNSGKKNFKRWKKYFII